MFTDRLSSYRHVTILIGLALLVALLAPSPTRAAGLPWNIVPSANTSPDEHNRLEDVDCTGEDDCWAIGHTTGCVEVSTGLPLPVSGVGACNLHKTLTEHWNGTEWSIVESPNPSPYANQLWDIDCIENDDCWAVGNYTGVGGRWTLTLHWDGVSWNLVPSPNPVAPLVDGWFTGVACVAGDDCWAVGGGADSLDGQVNNHTLIEHWDGTAWSIVPTPIVSPTVSHFLEDVACTRADDCWAAGYVLDDEDHYKTFVMHWDGTDWSIAESPSPSPTPRRLTGDTLAALTCLGESACWAVGSSTGGSLILAWDGTDWQVVPAPAIETSLQGVTCTSETHCWAVGNELKILEWDGATWKRARGPGGGHALTGVTCATEDFCMASGSHIPGPAGPRVSIFQTLTLATVDLARGVGEHIRVEPSGREAWITRYNGPADQLDTARAMAVSPDGSRVFVTGESRGADRREDYATIAYDATDGTPLWLARYDASMDGNDTPSGVSVSPDGTRVFVTGASQGTETGNDFATVAYDAADGHELWTARYDGPGSGPDAAHAVEVSPDGAHVYVAGGSQGAGTGEDLALLAYDAADGSELWTARYNGPDNGIDAALSLEIGPDGASVYVGGYSQSATTGPFDFATIAYNTLDGTERWARRYDGPARGYDVGRDLGVSPDGARVFVTGESNGGSNPSVWDARDFATVAYDAATGSELWVGRFDGPDGNNDMPNALSVSPDGTRVFVAGSSSNEDAAGAVTDRDSTTVAYDAARGEELWTARYNGIEGGSDMAQSLGTLPDGSRLYVTSHSESEESGGDFVTVGYDTSDGSEVSNDRYDGSGSGEDIPEALAVSPEGRRVFVTGRSQEEDGGLPGHNDFATIAYETGLDPSPSPTPTTTTSPTPTPTETPVSETTEVSFTENSAQSGQYSDETLFEARLTDASGNPIEGRELTFELTGTQSTRSFNATTDEDGIAKVTPILEEKPGAYQLTVRFAGDGTHTGSADTAAFVVDKEDTDLALTVDGKGAKRRLDARLSDRDTSSAGIEGRTVSFYSDGELLGTAVTNSDGVATFDPERRHQGGPHSYEARFAGDDYYEPSSGSAAT